MSEIFVFGGAHRTGEFGLKLVELANRYPDSDFMLSSDGTILVDGSSAYERTLAKGLFDEPK